MNEIVLQILQWFAAVGEIFLGYYTLGIFVGKRIVFEQKWYVLLCSLAIGSLLAFNRHWDTGLVSGLTLIMQILLMVLSFLNKLWGSRWFFFSVLAAYNVYNAFIQLLICFAILIGNSSVDVQSAYMNMSIYRVGCYYLALLFEVIVLFFLSKYMRGRKKALKNQMIEKNYIEMKRMYKNYAVTFHDMKNHLIVLEQYCRLGETENALKYIEKIKGPIKRGHRFVNIGNEVLDVVVNYKLIEAEQSGIQTEVVVDRIPEIKIDEKDLCTILGNLMDNAIEACDFVEDGEKWIRIQIRSAGKMLLIHISNSCLRSEADEEALRTKKRGLHGYGMQSVRECVEAYEGALKWERKEDVFHVQVTMFDI